VERKLCDTVPAGRPAEIALMRMLLEFDPSARPTCRAAIGSSYFEGLPSVERPELTDLQSEEKKSTIETAFQFEEADLNKNDLRILIANDLWRMKVEEEQAAATPTPPPPPQ